MTSDQYQEKLISLLQLQIRPVDCARTNKCIGVEKHIESIARGLESARNNFRSVLINLWSYGDIEEDMRSQIHKDVMGGLMFLMSALDAMVIADTSSADNLTSTMSFFNTPFEDPVQEKIREEIKALESFQLPTNTQCVDLQTVNNFYKHYMPSDRLFKVFTVKNGNSTINIQDVFIAWTGGESGPLLHDLIIPAYNKACDLLELMAKKLNMTIEVNKI